MQKLLISLLAIFFSCSAMADSVVEMCRDSDKICACAADLLKSEVGDDDYTLYETIGAAHIANQANGMGVSDAWDAAVKVEATRRGSTSTNILSKTNLIGKAHRKAINSCKK